MKKSVHKLSMVAFASAAISATQVFAQTNIPTGADSVVAGSVNFGTLAVVGNDPVTAFLRGTATISGTVQQATAETVIVNGTSATTNVAFVNFAFGNKEILALTYNTNNPSGAVLYVTNPVAVGLVPPALTALRTNAYTPIDTDYVLFAPTGGTVTVSTNKSTNALGGTPVATVDNGTRRGNFDIILAGSFAGRGVYTNPYNNRGSKVFVDTSVNPNVRTTNFFTAQSYTGSFSGVDLPTP